MRSSLWKWLCVAIALSVLGGCAELPVVRFQSPVVLSSRVCHKRIALAGRFSVHYQLDDQQESVHGTFRWGQDDTNMRIMLMSPIGQTLATIDVTPKEAVLVTTERAARTAQDVDALVFEELGWPLPVSGLRDWIQACRRDQKGKQIPIEPEDPVLTTLDGWQVVYPAWTDAPGGRRPKRIDLKRKDKEQGAIAVRLVIDEWLPRP